MDIYKKCKLICVHGCGQAYVDVEVYQDSEAMENDDYTLFCNNCHNCEWYVIPKKEDDIEDE